MKNLTCKTVLKDIENRTYACIFVDEQNNEIKLAKNEIGYVLNKYSINMEKIENVEIKQENIIFISNYTIGLASNNSYLGFKQVNDLISFENKAKLIGAETKRIYDHLIESTIGNKTIIVSDCEIHLADTGNRGAFEASVYDTIDLTNLHTENTVDMSRLFYRACAHEIIFGNFNTSKVRSMEQMFTYTSLNKLDLSSFDTSKVENMIGMFEETDIMAVMFESHLDLSNFNTKNVKSMKNMFKYCKIGSIDLSSFDVSNCLSMQQMFYACTFDELDLSSFKETACCDCSSMFSGVVADKIKMKNIKLKDNCGVDRMFYIACANVYTNDKKVAYAVLREKDEGLKLKC